MTIQVRPAGDRALLVIPDDPDRVPELCAALRAAAIPGVLDLLPAAATVLVQLRPSASADFVRARLRLAAEQYQPGPDPVRPAASVVIPVDYGGPDLDAVAALLDCPAAEVVRRHTAAVWRCAFVGFAPGFAYLTAPDWAYDLPRRATPRTTVPAGAVAVAAGYAAVYPAATPGGWHLIGTTTVGMFNVKHHPPALVTAGQSVRFVPAARDVTVSEVSGRMPDGSSRTHSPGHAVDGALVEAVGPLVTVQDLGRPGWWSSGVGRSGAADRGALTLANRLVGNPEAAAGLEVLLGGLTLRALRPLTVAVTGAPAPAMVDDRPVGHAAVLELRAGTRLRLGYAAAGLRVYVAVRGGIAAPEVLGSRSRDTLCGIGPEPVAAGAVLPVGPPPARLPLVDLAPVPALTNQPLTVPVRLGPRADWFTDPDALCAGRWQVSAQADRVGVRLDRVAESGPALVRAVAGELPTEGTALGSVQVPPDGRPVVFLADHPITGGYPVIAVVPAAAVDRMAQARPGQLIRFWSTPARR